METFTVSLLAQYFSVPWNRKTTYALGSVFIITFKLYPVESALKLESFWAYPILSLLYLKDQQIREAHYPALNCLDFSHFLCL